MSLTQCRECKHVVSHDAKSCPNCGAQSPSMPIGQVGAFFIGAAILAAVFWWPFKSNSDPEPEPPKPALTLAQRFPGPWQLDSNGSINRALVSQRTRGCGEYRYRRSVQAQDEFLIYCSRDRTKWTPYIVRTDTNEVWGPYALDPSVPPN